jgi:ATP-dependent Clp protease adaptor protein ClpS
MHPREEAATMTNPNESSAAPAVLEAPASKPRVERMPPWNVVLLDSDHHTYEYVVRMLQRIFGVSFEKAYDVAVKVDTQGRAVCLTTHREHAELKRDQISGFGRDPLSAGCLGSMSAIIEPAEFDGDGDDQHSGDDQHPGDDKTPRSP